MTCQHIKDDPNLSYDSRYVCQCGACHYEVESTIVHSAFSSHIHNTCTKCGRKWLAQMVVSM